MSPYAELVGGAIELASAFHEKEQIRAIPGSSFSSPPPTWTLRLTWPTCVQLRATFGASLHLGPLIKQWARDEKERRLDKVYALKEALDAPEPPLRPPGNLQLRGFQRADVAWMLAAGSGVLMNPTGSGKTPSTCTWARNMILERLLIICPTAMKIEWANELALWYPELESVVVSGTAAERRAQIAEAGEWGGACIINIEALRTHSRLAPYGQIELSAAERRPKELNEYEWDAVIVDEAHRLADPKSKQTRAAWYLAHRARHRWALTATPTTKGLDTFWPVLHLVAEDEHPTRSKYVDRYVSSSTNFWGGVTLGAVRPEAELEFLEVIKARVRRLPKEIILPLMPPIVPVQRWVEMGPEQAEAYRQMAAISLARVMNDDVLEAASTGAQYTRLGQFACSYARLEKRTRRKRDTGELESYDSVELEMPSTKVDAFLSDLHDWLAQEETVVVFATSKRLLVMLSGLLDKRKIKHSVIWGGQSEIERHEQKAAFQDGEVDVILVVASAGGTGLTLTRARIGAFLQRSWSRVVDTQAEGRFQRIGSEELHESLLRVDYITPGTVEVAQLDVLADKDITMDQVLRDKETIRRIMLGQHIEAKETA